MRRLSKLAANLRGFLFPTEEAVEREELQQAANANPLDKFQLLFQQVLQSLVIDRMEQNEDIAAKVLNEEEFGKVVARKIGEDIYKKLRLPKEIPSG